MPRLLLFTLLLCTLCLSGCGPAATTVTGTVTLEGKPLNSGLVTIKAGDQTLSANITPEGTYEIEGVPIGPATVAVMVPEPPKSQPKDPAVIQPEGVVANPVRIPKKYADLGASELKYEVSAGESLDIKLTK